MYRLRTGRVRVAMGDEDRILALGSLQVKDVTSATNGALPCLYPS